MDEAVAAYQSVSKTTALCPLKSGNWSGSRPFSFNGMTAKAPPPLASQLTERYVEFALKTVNVNCGIGHDGSESTLTRLVSHAFLEMRMLS